MCVCLLACSLRWWSSLIFIIFITNYKCLCWERKKRERERIKEERQELDKATSCTEEWWWWGGCGSTWKWPFLPSFSSSASSSCSCLHSPSLSSCLLVKHERWDVAHVCISQENPANVSTVPWHWLVHQKNITEFRSRLSRWKLNILVVCHSTGGIVYMKIKPLRLRRLYGSV